MPTYGYARTSTVEQVAGLPESPRHGASAGLTLYTNVNTLASGSRDFGRPALKSCVLR